MKFSAISLTFLGSLVVTAYSQPGNSIVERDYDSYAQILFHSGYDLAAVTKQVYSCKDDYYPVTQAFDTAKRNLIASKALARKSGTLTETDASELKVHFDNLRISSKELLKSLVAMKPVIQELYQCFNTYVFHGSNKRNLAQPH